MKKKNYKSIINKIIVLSFVTITLISYLCLNFDTKASQLSEKAIISKYADIKTTLVLDSGKSDSESVVMVFFAEGYDESEEDQTLFLRKVNDTVKYFKSNAPFSYFFDYLKIYAIHTISNDSGISGEGNKQFGCADYKGNPKTPECTPTSTTFNCIHKKDTFFKSYFYISTSKDREIYSMPSSSRDLAQEIALELIPEVDSINVIGNSYLYGGSASLPDTDEFGVALTSTNMSADKYDNFGLAMLHEMGHAFGNLSDEYWYSRGIDESRFNITSIDDPELVRWYNWIGVNGIDLVPFTENKTQDIIPFYRPSKSCRMRSLGPNFCSVCQESFILKMENITGKRVYELDNVFKIEELSDNTVKIIGLNGYYTSDLYIPETINGKTVTEIGNSAFENHSEFLSITLPDSLINIGNKAFKNCKNVSYIKIPDSVINIGESAFEDCKKLEVIQLSKNLVKLSSNSFTNCEKLKSITLPSNILKIEQLAFLNCKNLSFVQIEDVNIEISENAFDNCHLISDVYVCYNSSNSDIQKFVQIFSNSNIHKQLAAPINLNYNNNNISWDKVLFAKKYLLQIYVDNKLVDDLIIYDNNYDISEYKMIGNDINFSVCAIADNFVDSNVSRYLNSFNVVFNPNNGLDELIHYTVNDNTYIKEITDISIKKYSNFGGWYTDLSYNNQWDFENDIVNQDVILYAKWIPCKHKFVNNCDTDCDLCGYTRGKQHNFTKIEMTDNEHWVVCKNCNEEQENSRQKHTFIEDGDCTTEQICECGYILKSKKHNLEIQSNYTASHHILKCTNDGCQYYEEIEHIYNQQIVDDEYLISKANCVEPNKYYKSCVCGKATTDEFIVGNVEGHNYNFIFINNDEKGHYYLCITCGEIDKVINHEFDNDCDNECDICGYTRNTSHDFSVGKSNSTQKWIECIHCGYEKDGSRIDIFMNNSSTDLIQTNNCTMSFNLIKNIIMINVLFIVIIIFKKK